MVGDLTGGRRRLDSRQSCLVELVGPAGAGKSAVFDALLARDETIEGRPSLRKVEHAAVLASEITAVLGTLLRRGVVGPGVKLEQIRMMMYLQALPRILAGADSTGTRIIVFDQGPVYFLTRPSLRNVRLTAWRDRMFTTWASLLDLVVYLDAPDPVLGERINSRGKWHALKGVRSETALEVLTTSRSAYEEAMSKLEAHGRGPRLLQFDTSRQPAGEIGDEILSTLARSNGG